MTNIRDKEFWENEQKCTWQCFEEAKKDAEQGKIATEVVWNYLEPECMTLAKFFSYKIHNLGSSEEMQKLESEARDLGYLPTKGVKGWFRNRLEEKEKRVRERAKQFRMDKKELEIECVRQFYKNEGRYYQDLQPQPENSPVDVIAVEKIPYQVTYLQRDEESQLGKWGSYEGECKPPEELRKNIEEVVGKKLKRARRDIILLLIAFVPEDRWEEAIRGLSINSSFKEIYIVTLKRNFRIWPVNSLVCRVRL